MADQEAKITQEELKEIFGDIGNLPWEAYDLIFVQASPEKTVGQVRADLRALAQRLKASQMSLSIHARSGCHCDDCRLERARAIWPKFNTFDSPQLLNGEPIYSQDQLAQLRAEREYYE